MTSFQARPRALVITPTFFGYEAAIVQEFERQGFETEFVDERPSNGTIARALLRLRRDLVDRSIDKYYRRKLRDLADTPLDVVFVVRAEATPRWFLEALRKINPQAHFAFYIWDAVSKANNCLDVLDCFDTTFSFDPSDVAIHPQFSYLPLFYTAEFAPPEDTTEARRHSLCFVGTLHPGRYAYVNQLFENQSRTFAFFYVQAKWYFAVVKYLTRMHSNVPWSDVSFRKMNRNDVAKVFRESEAALDMPQPNQTGLTIRTFEVLASGTVLVTTNRSIVDEPFFDPARVIVVESFDDVDLHEVRRQLRALKAPNGAPVGFERYSIESWVRTITMSRRVEALDDHAT